MSHKSNKCSSPCVLLHQRGRKPFATHTGTKPFSSAPLSLPGIVSSNTSSGVHTHTSSEVHTHTHTQGAECTHTQAEECTHTHGAECTHIQAAECTHTYKEFTHTHTRSRVHTHIQGAECTHTQGVHTHMNPSHCSFHTTQGLVSQFPQLPKHSQPPGDDFNL